MRQLKALSIVPVFLVLAACVTINVYFPAVAAEKAADRIIEDVWGPKGERPEGEDGAPESETEPQSRAPEASLPVAMRVLNVLIAPAHAQQPRIDISTPAIKRLTASMEQRHQQLRPYYASGAIGLTRDALVTVRDLNAVPLPERGQVRQLVAAENEDRKALYREIAIANDHPEWEDQIRDVFAGRWVSNAQSGWYYQNDSGAWVQK
ncbi:YdbL family protein [Arhodomonas sp. AD133]|uniref:YdbL family protein n=1 Tax=Arhodomonas sp. AD133 TaxID=3415009 RepID=UPI003EBCBCE7